MIAKSSPIPLLVASKIRNKMIIPKKMSRDVVSPPLIAISSHEKIMCIPVNKLKITKINLKKLSIILFSRVFNEGKSKNKSDNINIK